jgi:hypothetical protein
MELLTQTLDALEIGAGRPHANLTMFPLLGGRAGDPDYHTLDEVLAAGTARVTEISDSGSVPELRFRNAGDWAVLLLDGEELVGAKQNRVLNLTILAPAGKEIRIPVSCVEAGRWSHVSAEFAAAPRAQYAAGRAKKAAAVNASLRETGQRRSDQGEVWADISAKARRLAAASDTEAMAAIYEGHAANVDAFVEALPAVERQAGALFAINGELVCLDLFDHPATLRKLLPKLVRSYALDAIDAGIPSRGGGPAGVTAAVNPKALIEEVRRADPQAFPAVGEGEDLRLTGKGLTGGALIARGRVVHLSAFRVEVSEQADHATIRSRISRPSVRRAR